MTVEHYCNSKILIDVKEYDELDVFQRKEFETISTLT